VIFILKNEHGPNAKPAIQTSYEMNGLFRIMKRRRGKDSTLKKGFSCEKEKVQFMGTTTTYCNECLKRYDN